MAAQFKNGFAESAAIKHLQMFAGHISGYVVESEHASFRFKFWEDRRPTGGFRFRHHWFDFLPVVFGPAVQVASTG